MQGAHPQPARRPRHPRRQRRRRARRSCSAISTPRTSPTSASTSGSPSPARPLAMALVHVVVALGRPGSLRRSRRRDPDEARDGRRRRHRRAHLVHPGRAADRRLDDRRPSGSGRSLAVGGRGSVVLVVGLPFLVVGAVLGLASVGSLNALALGDDVARALGRRLVLDPRRHRAVAIVLLAGAATALVGPIAFVGLIVPHVVRRSVGPDYRWVLPLEHGLRRRAAAGGRRGRAGWCFRPARSRSASSSRSSARPFFIVLIRRRRMAGPLTSAAHPRSCGDARPSARRERHARRRLRCCSLVLGARLHRASSSATSSIPLPRRRRGS